MKPPLILRIYTTRKQAYKSTTNISDDTQQQQVLRETPIMRISLIVFCTVALLTSGAVAADGNIQESTPIELSAEQMDQITAGALVLPNDKVIFSRFDNPAPNVDGYVATELGGCNTATGVLCHPSITRRSDAAFVTAGHGPSVNALGVNDGPWAATVKSPVIDFMP
jgi:hypothetical protein